MIKKIILVWILCCLVVSCGKKGDPEYKDIEKQVEMQNILINRV